MKRKIFTLALIAIVGFTIILFLIVKDNSQTNMINEKGIQIPKGSVHWHPKLTILIDGEQIKLPNDIGIGTGRIVDTHLSGMKMSPTHTHESDGTIHLENLNPASKPETLTLGYFFYVWNKTFNSTCIFEYCTGNGVLKIYVNGVENTEFENYVMHDGDQVLIEYKTKEVLEK